MAGRILVDTNILLYAYDRGESAKQPLALTILDRLVAHDLGGFDATGLGRIFRECHKETPTPFNH
jgi:hypothetical protein